MPAAFSPLTFLSNHLPHSIMKEQLSKVLCCVESISGDTWVAQAPQEVVRNKV